MEVPPRWEGLDLDRFRDVILVIGAPDTGKTTLARYLYSELVARGRQAAFLDGDPGQSSLGTPTTMTIALGGQGEAIFPPQGARWQRFVGSITPAGHMLPLIVGAHRLAEQARQAGADVIIYDTSGLVDPGQGGAALKLAKTELLRPPVVVAIQRRSELEAIVLPLRRSATTRLIELPPARAVRPRERAERQAHRRAMYRDCFQAAEPLSLRLGDFSILPASQCFVHHRLLALQDKAGFVLGLGIALQNHVQDGRWTVLTPLDSLDQVDTLWLGDVAVNPGTWEDRLLR
jgi:polynucleotide 5'-hydroxyl-kinase GRC3/NOL9